MRTGGIRREAVILGLGHIGASLAARLASRGWRVWGWDRNVASVKHCRKQGWISKANTAPPRAPFEIETHNPICVVALPEAAVVDPRLAALLARLPAGAFVTDVFSSKGEATTRLAGVCAELGLRYGWSHPLAGREGSGAASADPTIFTGARCLIDSQAPAAVRAELGRFWKNLSCNVEYLSTEAHQKRMAAGSHLMHVLAFSLMHSIGDTRAASPSVLGATRVAKSSPEAWASILISNRDELGVAVQRLSRELTKISKLVRNAKEEALLQYLLEGQRLRLKMEEKR